MKKSEWLEQPEDERECESCHSKVDCHEYPMTFTDDDREMLCDFCAVIPFGVALNQTAEVVTKVMARQNNALVAKVGSCDTEAFKELVDVVERYLGIEPNSLMARGVDSWDGRAKHARRILLDRMENGR